MPAPSKPAEDCMQEDDAEACEAGSSKSVDKSTRLPGEGEGGDESGSQDLGQSAPQAKATAARGGKTQFMMEVGNLRFLDSKVQALPLFVYAFATNPALNIGQYSPPNCNGSVPQAAAPQGGQGMERLLSQLDGNQSGVVAKMLIFSSAATAEFYLQQPGFADDLKQRKIEWLGYNMEGDKTPGDEICSIRGRENATDNAVTRFAAAAKAAGFKFIWGPIRHDLDKVSDPVIQGMCKAGLRGIAMQEQNTIQAGVSTRIQSVLATISRYRSMCGNDLHASVQIMARSCGSDQCQDFVSGLMPELDAIAIWATGAEREKINPLILTLSQTPGLR